MTILPIKVLRSVGDVIVVADKGFSWVKMKQSKVLKIILFSEQIIICIGATVVKLKFNFVLRRTLQLLTLLTINYNK